MLISIRKKPLVLNLLGLKILASILARNERYDEEGSLSRSMLVAVSQNQKVQRHTKMNGKKKVRNSLQTSKKQVQNKIKPLGLRLG